MKGERVVFSAPTSHSFRRVHGTLVAQNLAVHRPLNAMLRDLFVDLSQISSGKRVGRFRKRAQAESFALQALELVPELGSGAELTQDQMNGLSALRGRHGGRR